MSKRVAIYDRPCPFTKENTLQAMRDYARAQERWEVIEYVEGKGKGQPVLNNLLRDSKADRFDVVVCYSLLAVGNSLKQLLTVMEKLKAMEVEFISLTDGLDANSTAGTLLDALTKYQKDLTGSKIRMGLELARMRNVVLGRKPIEEDKVQDILDAHKRDMSVRDVAKLTKVPKSTCWRVIKDYEKSQVAVV